MLLYSFFWICLWNLSNIHVSVQQVPLDAQLILNQALLKNQKNDFCITRYAEYNHTIFRMPSGGLVNYHNFHYYGCRHPLCKKRETRSINPTTVCKTSLNFYSTVEETDASQSQPYTLIKYHEQGNTPFDVSDYVPVTTIDETLTEYLTKIIEENKPIEYFTIDEIRQATYKEFKYPNQTHFATSYDTLIKGCGPDTLPLPGKPYELNHFTCGQYRVITYDSILPYRKFEYFEYVGTA